MFYFMTNDKVKIHKKEYQITSSDIKRRTSDLKND